METYARAKELTELVALLDALNSPAFKLLTFTVNIIDENGEDFGIIGRHEDEGYVYVPDVAVLE